MSDDYSKKDGKIYKEGFWGNTEEYEIKRSLTGDYIETPDGIKDVDQKLSGETEITHGFRHFDNEKDITTITPDYSFPNAQTSTDSTEQISPNNELVNETESSTEWSPNSERFPPDSTDTSSSGQSFGSSSTTRPYSSTFRGKSHHTPVENTHSKGLGCVAVALVCCIAILFFFFLSYIQSPVPDKVNEVKFTPRQSLNSFDFQKEQPVKVRQSTLHIIPTTEISPKNQKSTDSVSCILPNGSEKLISYRDCRKNNGVIYE